MDDRPANSPDAKKPIDEMSFEEAAQRLERIIDRIESGEAGLERSIREYEEGAALLKRCRSILEQAEQRVEELTAKDAARAPDASTADDNEESPF